MRATRLLWLVLAWLGAVYVVSDLGRHALDDVDGLYTNVAREMVQRGDFVTPYADGVRFLDKPPLTFWAMAASYTLLGLGEFSGRLPFVLAILATAWLLYRAADRAQETKGGILGAACFSLCVGTFLFTRTIQPDTFLVAFEALAFLGFLEWYSGESRTGALIFWAGLAGAVLSKGLVGLVVSFGMVTIFLFARGELARLGRLFSLGPLVLFAALTTPWFVLVAARNPGFLWHFFVEEHVLRFLGRRQPLDYHSLPVWLFWVLVPVWLLPFSAFLPAVGALLRRRAALSQASRNLVDLCLSWAAAGLALFSLATRLEHYAFAFLPPIALLIGLALSRFVQRSAESVWVERGLYVLAGGGVLAGAALWEGASLFGAPLLSLPARSLSADTHDFGPLFHLPAAVVPSLIHLARLAATVSALGGFILFTFVRWSRPRGALLFLFGWTTAFCVLSTEALKACDPALSTQEFGTAIRRVYKPGDSVVAVGDFETANSLSVYTSAPLLVLDGKASVLEWGLRYPDAPVRVLNGPAFAMLWNGSSRVFLLTPPNAGWPPHSSEVLRSAERVLFCNRAIGKP